MVSSNTQTSVIVKMKPEQKKIIKLRDKSRPLIIKDNLNKEMLKRDVK